MTGLKIAPQLTLPLEAVTETFVILAKRGSGKTYTAAVIAEEIIGAGHPCVVIDPIGVWWGLRSSADAKGPGLPVVIFGGDHGDVPLDEKSGELIADAIVGERFSAVLDLSLLSKTKSKQFMAAFIARLYHRNRDPLHIIVDEADAFAPQRTDSGGAVLLGAMEDLVRRGRARGIGCTLITQRPAVLNKDVLTQAEVLICLRMNGVRDVAAIDEWVRLHADEDEARELKKSLPSLKVGTAWVWSPGWLGILEQVHIRKRTTFDSSATPGVGQKRIVPKQMADIDIEALGAKIAATAEEAKASDPKVLQARVAQLERELAKERTKPAPAATVERVEVPVLDPAYAKELDDLLTPVRETLNYLGGALSMLAHHPEKVRADVARSTRTRQPTSAAAAPPARAPRAAAPDPVDGEIHLRAGARRILETLARNHPMRLTKAQIGTLAKFKITGGTFGTYWSEINRLGFIDDNGTDYTLTDAGFDYIGIAPGNPQTTEEILETYRSVLRSGARNMLDIVVGLYPGDIHREDLAAQLEMAATGGTFGTYLSDLRRNGLVDVGRDGLVRANDILFPGGAA